MPKNTDQTPQLIENAVSGCFKSKFKIGMQFERFPDAENGLILLIITKVSKYHLYFGSGCKRHKSWLVKNNFRLVQNIR